MKPLPIAILFLVASLGSVAARADQASLMACIEKYKTVGLSPDLAYSECKKSSAVLVTTVRRFRKPASPSRWAGIPQATTASRAASRTVEF